MLPPWGFYPVMDTMIRDEQFWAEAPIYALHYDVHGMFALAEAGLRYDGTDLLQVHLAEEWRFVEKDRGRYLRMAFPLERNGTEAERFGWRRSAMDQQAP